ncbi:7939_t:CDS:2, partial [Acaulospora morrowiae]
IYNNFLFGMGSHVSPNLKHGIEEFAQIKIEFSIIEKTFLFIRSALLEELAIGAREKLLFIFALCESALFNEFPKDFQSNLSAAVYMGGLHKSKSTPSGERPLVHVSELYQNVSLATTVDEGVPLHIVQGTNYNDGTILLLFRGEQCNTTILYLRLIYPDGTWKKIDIDDSQSNIPPENFCYYNSSTFQKRGLRESIEQNLYRRHYVKSTCSEVESLPTPTSHSEECTTTSSTQYSEECTTTSSTQYSEECATTSSVQYSEECATTSSIQDSEECTTTSSSEYSEECDTASSSQSSAECAITTSSSQYSEECDHHSHKHHSSEGHHHHHHPHCGNVTHKPHTTKGSGCNHEHVPHKTKGTGTGPGETGSHGATGTGTGTGRGVTRTGTGIGPGETGTGIGPGETGTGIGPGETGTGIGPGETGTGIRSGIGGPSETGTGIRSVTRTGPGETGTGIRSGIGGPSETGTGIRSESVTGPGETGTGISSGIGGPSETGTGIRSVSVTGPGETGTGIRSGIGGPSETGTGLRSVSVTGPGETGTGIGPSETGTGIISASGTGPAATGTGIGPSETGTGIGSVSGTGPGETGTGIGPSETGTVIGPVSGTSPGETGTGIGPSETGTVIGSVSGTSPGETGTGAVTGTGPSETITGAVTGTGPRGTETGTGPRETGTSEAITGTETGISGTRTGTATSTALSSTHTTPTTIPTKGIVIPTDENSGEISAINIYAIKNKCILVTYFSDIPASHKIKGLIITWNGDVENYTIDFGEECTYSQIIKNIDELEFLRVCYKEKTLELDWTIYSTPDDNGNNVTQTSSGVISNLNITSYIDFPKIFSVENRKYGVVTVTHEVNTTIWKVSIYWIYGQNVNGPYEIYTLNDKDVIVFKVFKCTIARQYLGYSCVIYVEKRGETKPRFIDIDFYNTGSINGTHTFTINDVPNDQKPFSALALRYGGFIILTKSNTTINGFAVTNEGNNVTRWGLPTNYTYLPITGVSQRNVVWAFVNHNGSSWTVITSDTLSNYNEDKMGKYGTPTVIYTSPDVNSTIPVPHDSKEFVIKYSFPCGPSSGYVTIFMHDDNGTHPVFRMPANNCTFNHDTVTFKAIPGAISSPNKKYTVNVDDGFITDTDNKQDAPGIHDKWNFTTGGAVNNGTGPASVIILLTSEGTTLYVGKSISRDVFVTKLRDQIARAIGCSTDRLYIPTKFQYKHDTPSDQIFMRVDISEAGTTADTDAITLSQYLDNVIKYKDMSLISTGDTTKYLDSDNGAWRLSKYKWALFALFGLLFLFLLCCWGHLRHKKGRNLLVFVLCPLILVDFGLDITFVARHGKDEKWLYPT